MLSVSDDGCGISQKIKTNIFEPFFSTKTLHEGTGLGLATVFGIVDQNNGFIDVQSEPGSGATFSLYFPRYLNHDQIKPAKVNAEAISGQGELTRIFHEKSRGILS